jgi:membrane protein DedA with SNARE-associated domain
MGSDFVTDGVLASSIFTYPNAGGIVHEVVDFLLKHGYTLLFGWVLGEQLGLPIPSAPVLLAAGALAGSRQMYFSLALLFAVVAAITSDVIWYEIGKHKGSKVLQLLCRISLEPDSCVRRTEGLYEKYGERSLLWAKFVPGLNTAAPPVAGMFGMPLWRFLIFDIMGSILWSGSFLGLGWLFSDQLEDVARYAERFGFWLIVAVVLALAAYIVKKYRERRDFLKSLIKDRITPEELKAMLDRREPLTIIDLRHSLDALPDPRTVPGALRMTPEELKARQAEIPRDRGVILYCT